MSWKSQFITNSRKKFDFEKEVLDLLDKHGVHIDKNVLVQSVVINLDCVSLPEVSFDVIIGDKK